MLRVCDHSPFAKMMREAMNVRAIDESELLAPICHVFAPLSEPNPSLCDAEDHFA
ncbi:hypothetical protein PC117_g13864 [Phytophthora cactorum]|uniref:Uncharacterized protein n=2 Tax=Phytophthora cactorum TaxID=29920 RepID=A0A8T1CZ21_9STRA|nr:hypothetical protein PC117_g13864 [Phytophthora cactorum]KAG2996527.1 hypothetical protein PC120_g21476 [Phytophthora cactorum]